MEQENQNTSENSEIPASTFDRQYAEILIKRLEAQRNSAFNQIAMLEAELIKAQSYIQELQKDKK